MLATCMLMHLGQNLTHLCIAVISSDMAAHTSVWHAQIMDQEAPGNEEWYARTQDVEWVGGVPCIVVEPHIRRIRFYVRLPDHVDQFEVSGDGQVTSTRARSIWSAGSIRTSLASPDVTILGTCMAETQNPPGPERGHIGWSCGDLR